MTANDKEHLVFLLDQLYNLINDNEDNAAIYCCVITDFNENKSIHTKSVLILGKENIIDQTINDATDHALDFYTK